MTETIDRTLRRLASWLAVVGGIVLVAIIVLTVVSITGRSLGDLDLGPIPGDFELVEGGTAFAIFAFMGWCQLNRGHIAVDLFAPWLGPRLNAVIDVVATVLMTVAAGIIAWRHTAGMLDKLDYAETTFILALPVWWFYAASLVGAVTFAVASAWTVREAVMALPQAWREGRR